MNHLKTDVLVVGAGPAGVSAALFLAKYGVDALTITKYPGLANSPRAHITNQRTIEIFRDQGLEQPLIDAAIPHHLMGNTCWATSFKDQEIVRYMTWGTSPERRADYERASPSAMCNLPQHVMEPIIYRGAVDAGADVRFGWELVSIQQDEHKVFASIHDRSDGSEVTVEAKYVIGADGAKSTVAQALDFELEGEADLSSAVSCWIEADLTRYVAHRPSVLYWIIQPGSENWLGAGTYIAVEPWNEWVLLFVFDPREGDPDLSEEALIRAVRGHVGDPELEVKVKGVGTWQVNHQIAKAYRKGRVFIAGDAAHRHPPANGLGSNTSVQDTYNLCWKLAYVLKGWADPSLLDSYHDERRPVGKQVVDRATESMGNLVPVMSALGAGAPDDSGVAELSAATLEGKARRQALRKALDLQQWHFNCHGVELGQTYMSDAVISDGSEPPVPTRDPQVYYHPTTFPGSRLPHAWVVRDGEQVSTHDLVGKGRFVLLTGIGGEAWCEAAHAVADELGVPLTAEVIGFGQRNADVLGQWAVQADVEEEGAVLVRPDAHVAWRSETMVADPKATLRGVMRSILGWADTLQEQESKRERTLAGA